MRDKFGADVLRKKVKALAGDILEPKLGLSTEDEDTIVEEVSVVFHSAATVRFDEPLKLVFLIFKNYLIILLLIYL